MRNIILVVLLFLILTSLSFAAVKQKFEPFVNHQDFSLGIDMDSVKVIKGPDYPLASLDARLILKKPQKHLRHKNPIASFISTVAADCKNDNLLLLKSASYDVKGNQLDAAANTIILKNPNHTNSPVTRLMLLMCEASAKANLIKKRNEDPMLNI